MEKKTPALDTTDRAILTLLQQDAALTNKEIAVHLGMSTTPVYERIKRLEREGYIERYTALLSRQKLHLSLLVFCDVALKEHNRDFLLRFEQSVGQFPEVLECHHVTGEYDYVLKVVAADMDDYQRFIKEKLATLENIGRVQSHFVMTEVKNSTILPL